LENTKLYYTLKGIEVSNSEENNVILTVIIEFKYVMIYKMLKNISIVGAGAWGTTQAVLYAEKGINVTLWVYEKDLTEEIIELRENKKYLPGFQIPQTIEITNDLDKAVKSADAVFFAIPSAHFRKIIQKITCINHKTILISTSKGIEIDSLKTMSQVLEEFFPKNPVAALSGPNLSKEICEGKPSATVMASKNINTAKVPQESLNQERFRIYISDDIIGVELGGALKNPIAITAGIAEGLGLGHNALSALIVRGIKEISRLGLAMGAKEHTLFGLSGIGDMITTCTSALSRNHAVGIQLAKSKKTEEAIKIVKGIAEGIPTTKAAIALGKKYNVELPIISKLSEVLYKNKEPFKAISELLTRKLKKEEE
jgi:glycerol-3-phosphate dehydrogenase (NAD(P)+)